MIDNKNRTIIISPLWQICLDNLIFFLKKENKIKQAKIIKTDDNELLFKIDDITLNILDTFKVSLSTPA